MTTKTSDLEPRPAARRYLGLGGHDVAIIAMTGVLAGCGLIYEYLLAHTAGRILGAIETVIFAMIGIMIVSMGIGSFLARVVANAFTGFAWLETGLALLGGTSVLLLSAISALVVVLPISIGETYGLPPDLVPRGALVETLEDIAEYAPFVLGALLGIMVGMEIPLIARVRLQVHQAHLAHNTGTIYGADYLGAGVGAALWVGFMLTMEPARAAVLTAAANLGVGFLFLLLYGRFVRWPWLVLAMHGLVAAVLAVIAANGATWSQAMEDLLYQDRVVYRIDTGLQRLTVTERRIDPRQAPIYTFYINGRTQFASNDEHIYHAMLTYPAMAASARRERVLIVGGGDGLALRDVLRWNPNEVVLLDLDSRLVDFFAKPELRDGRVVNRPLLELNQFAFSDPRVRTRFGDAFLTAEALIREGRLFDAIIVDLPDPSHIDLNRLYTVRFYTKLRQLLAGDGAIAIQSTSPYHARAAFLSIGKTLAEAGYRQVEQYHQNVPSFGDWGWSIATLNGAPASRRLQALGPLPVDDGWTTKAILRAAFAFPSGFFSDLEAIVVNRLGNGVVYQYHQQAWERQQGIYRRLDE